MSVEASWDGLSRDDWEALLGRAERHGLQQDWAYGAAVACAGHAVRRAAVRHRGRVVAVAQVVERGILGVVRLALLMRGPVWLEPALRDRLEEATIHALRTGLAGAVLLWSPERAPAGGRLAGLRRVMTGYSTVWLDLRCGLAQLRSGLHGKWRNMLRRSEQERLDVEQQQGGPLVDWLLDESERQQRRARYRGPSADFLKRLQAAGGGGSEQTCLFALERGCPVAGILLQRHGNCATYYVGCTSARGRAVRAHHLLLWRAIGLLREQGVGFLDLGGVDTVRSPGIARFKLGLGGEVVTFAGTYLGKPFRARSPAPRQLAPT